MGAGSLIPQRPRVHTAGIRLPFFYRLEGSFFAMLKVMVIGCGGIAPAHIEGYLAFPDDAAVTVLADGNVARAEGLIEKYRLEGARAVADYREALAEVDVVSICTPPALHEQMAVDALGAGCHVLLEKPMAPSLEACDHILQAARESGRLLSVVVQSRYISGIRNAIDMVRGGEYGRALFTQINSVWYRGQHYYDLNWRGRWTVEGGGCTLNHSIHHIDLLLWAKGLPAAVVSTMHNLNHANSEEEDCSLSTLIYPDGTVAQINSLLVAHGEPQLFTFQMEKAGIAVPFRALASKPRDNGFPMPDEDMERKVQADFDSRPKLPYENHTGQVGNFLGAILRGETMLATGQDGRNCIELITAIYKSAITGQPAALPIAQDDGFYTAKWREDAPHFHEKQSDVEAFADTTVTNFKNKF